MPDFQLLTKDWREGAGLLAAIRKLLIIRLSWVCNACHVARQCVMLYDECSVKANTP